MAKVPWWVWASVVACAAASLVSLSSRHRVETSNRAVGIMMSMEDIEAIASGSDQSLQETYAYLRDRGLVGVAITDRTIEDMIETGEVILSLPLTGGSITLSVNMSRESRRRPILLTNDDPEPGSDESEANRIEDLLLLHGGSSNGRLNPGAWFQWDPPDHLVPMVREISAGIDSRQSVFAKKQGLIVIGRVSNYSLIGNRIVASSFEDMKGQGIDSYLIAGDQAIGNRLLLETTRDALVDNDMTYVSPEFVTLGGDAYLRKELADRTIRLHSISALEAQRMSQRDLNERFAKAFRERGVRWLLLRPTTKASNDPLKQVGETLVSLRSAIRSAGGEVKEPRPFEDPKVHIGLICLIGLISLPAVAWAAIKVCGSGPLAWSVVGLFVALVLTTFLTEDAKKLALLMALAFPVVGYLIVSSMKKTIPIRDFLLFTAVSAVGGLAVGGMLTGVEFMIRADQFFGTKLAIFGPILVVGYLLLKRHGTVKELMSKPVTWGTAAVAIAGLAAMFVLLARSGNENPAAVSGLELQIRSLLDQLLFVRPRTKEVMIGHPALMFGLMMMLYRPNLRGWASLLLFVGMVGQTSVVNSFCHLHTPIALSLARVGIGVVFGGIIGLLLWVVVKRWIPAEEPK